MQQLRIPDSTFRRTSDEQVQDATSSYELREGIVVGAVPSDELLFAVEIILSNDETRTIPCSPLTRFSSPLNHEQIVYGGFSYSSDEDSVAAGAGLKPGDRVLVGTINGKLTRGVILGALPHFSLAEQGETLSGDQPAYEAIFNGIQKTINSDGEYTVMFRGVATNAAEFGQPVSTAKDIPFPEYSNPAGGSFYSFDKTGSFHVSDGAKQILSVDKPNGAIQMTSQEDPETPDSPRSLLRLNSQGQVELSCSTLKIEAKDKATVAAPIVRVEASTSATMKSPKIAIGTDGVELLKQISDAFDALGKVKVITPMGPASPMSASPDWVAVKAVQDKIKSITGTI